MIGNGYELTKAFYAEVEQNEAMQVGATAFHHSLYTWICELRNRMQREIIDLPVKYTMQMAFIGSDKTLKKCMDDLANWNIIEILQQGSNQHVSTKVKLAFAFLRKHCETDATASPSAVADIRQQYESGANAVRTTKTYKTNKTNKPPQSPKGDEVAELLSSFCFQSDAFKTAWQEWTQFRKELKKPLTPTAIRQQLKNLGEYSEPQAIAMIEQSIRSGWPGIYELKQSPRESAKKGAYTPFVNTNPQPVNELC